MRLACAIACVIATYVMGPGVPPAAGAEGLFLTWNDCPLSPASSSAASAACPIDHTFDLVIAFELAQPADSVIGIEAIVDVQTEAASLPNWWQYAPGGCRYGSLVASADFTGRTACVDVWAGQANLDGPPVYTPGAPHGSPSQARIFVSFAVPSASFRALQSSTRYYGARLEFRSDAPGCPGCEVAACLVLNSVRLVRLPGSVPGDVVVVTPGPANANWASWQGLGASCAAVPVRRTTWGQLKSLYR